MLQRIRDGLQGQKWLAWLVLGAIGLTFVFWGGSGALDFSGASGRNAVEVNGVDVPAEEATKQWSEAQSRWAEQFGTDMPPEQRAKAQDDILDGLALEQVIEARMREGYFRVGKTALLAAIQKEPAFSNAQGKYDPLIARAALSQARITDGEYAQQLEAQLMRAQLQRGIGGSYFLTRAELQRLFNLENEEREVQYAVLQAEKFAGAQPIDEASINSYYEKNADRFMTTESVALEFAELRLEQLAAQVTPTETDLKKVYEENRERFVVQERRRPSHILIKVDGDDDAAALKKAETVLAEARAGKNFGELAKKHSEDVTASQGGDMGLVEQRNFPGPFSDALFAMKVGEISAPVKSQFGYHIIKLEEIQPGTEKGFAEVRAELDSQYRADRAADLFADRQEEIATRVESGESDLDKLAQNLGLARGSVPEFLRGGGGEPLGSSVDLQQVVFSDAILNQGKIGGPVPLGEDRMVLVKVTKHQKPAVKPLSAVREEVVTLLRQERGVAAAQAAADAALPKLQGGEKLDALAATWGITVEPARFVGRGDPSIPAALRTAIFESARPSASPVVKAAKLDDGSTALFVVSRTRVADITQNPTMAQQQNAAIVQRSASGDIAAYVTEARRKAKVVKNPGVFE